MWRLRRELGGERVVEHAARGREHDRPRPDPGLPVGRLERRIDDVDPHHHPGAAAVGRVIDLPGAERRRLPVVEAAQLRAAADGVGDVALLAEPAEPLGEQGEDIDPHEGRGSLETRDLGLASPPHGEAGSVEGGR